MATENSLPERIEKEIAREGPRRTNLKAGRGGMIEDISERLLRQFAASLQASLTGGGRTAPVHIVRSAPPGS